MAKERMDGSRVLDDGIGDGAFRFHLLSFEE
jgi:hypothetical protein